VPAGAALELRDAVSDCQGKALECKQKVTDLQNDLFIKITDLRHELLTRIKDTRQDANFGSRISELASHLKGIMPKVVEHEKAIRELRADLAEGQSASAPPQLTPTGSSTAAAGAEAGGSSPVAGTSRSTFAERVTAASADLAEMGPAECNAAPDVVQVGQTPPEECHPRSGHSRAWSSGSFAALGDESGSPADASTAPEASEGPPDMPIAAACPQEAPSEVRVANDSDTDACVSDELGAVKCERVAVKHVSDQRVGE